MKLALFCTLIFGGLAFVAVAEPAFDLKPGFYSGDDPGWKQLSDLRQKADVHIVLSWHAGISLGDRSRLTMDQLKEALKKVKKRTLASVLLEKNYTDGSLHLKVEKLLLDEGFKGVLITGAHSSGTFLEKYTNKAEGGADQPATAPKSKSESKENPKPESEARPQ